MKPTADELEVLIEYAEGRLKDWDGLPQIVATDKCSEVVAEDFQLLEALQYLKGSLATATHGVGEDNTGRNL